METIELFLIRYSVLSNWGNKGCGMYSLELGGIWHISVSIPIYCTKQIPI